MPTSGRRIRRLVTFTGFIEESAKPALLRSADVAVFPRPEANPSALSCLEAIARSDSDLAGTIPDTIPPCWVIPTRCSPCTDAMPRGYWQNASHAPSTTRHGPNRSMRVKHCSSTGTMRRTIADQVEQVYMQAIAKRRAA